MGAEKLALDWFDGSVGLESSIGGARGSHITNDFHAAMFEKVCGERATLVFDFRVGIHADARADEVAITVNVVDPADCRPEFVFTVEDVGNAASSRE